MTPLHTAVVLRRLCPDLQIFDYGVDFNALWRMELQSGHVIVVWADTPADPDVRPVHTEPHLTPFDWAITACALRDGLRVTIVDLREAAHDEETISPGRNNCAALRWLRTQRPESVPWLRRLGISDLLGVSTAADLRSLLGTPLLDNVALHIAGRIKSNIRELDGSAIRLIAYTSLTGREISLSPTSELSVQAKEALKALPVCNLDLTKDASHHEIANLVAPLVLLRRAAAAGDARDGFANHRLALRQVLRAAGFVSEPLVGVGAGPVGDEELATVLANARIDHLRLVLCDDQWHHGWLDWLCERTGVSPIPADVRHARNSPDDEPMHVATGNGVSIWVSSGPTWLKRKLNDLASKPLEAPLRRRLRLTSDNDKFNEILLLDLRLFAGRTNEEQAFLIELQALHQKFTGDDTEAPISHPAEILSLLPRTLSLADPLLPIAVFSSTGRRDVIDRLSGCPGVVTSFAKPRLLSENTGDLVANTEEAFSHALAESVDLVRRRRAVVGLIRFRGHFPKGGYDVQNGITQSRKTRAPTVHRGVHGRRRPAGLG